MSVTGDVSQADSEDDLASVDTDDGRYEIEDVDDGSDDSADGDGGEDIEALVENLPAHVVRRAVVLPEHKILFVPTPKAAVTTLLWQLAALGGQDVSKFDNSDQPEVSAALTIHDMNRWESRFKVSAMSDAERAEVLSGDGWLRFTTVRNPASRVWSAWQSKLLLREPRFVVEWGERPWFPRVPSAPDEILADFRAFVLALADPETNDVHWTLQHDLLSGIPLTHIGRAEAIGDTIAVLEAHLESLGMPAQLQPGRDNRTPLRMPPAAYDAASAEVMNARYAVDLETYDYPAIVASEEKNTAWSRATKPLLPILSELIDHNARIGQLSATARRREAARRRLVSRVLKAEQRLETVATRRSGPGGPSSPVMTNLEQKTNFTVRWSWADQKPLESGFTAIVRVKDEAKPLPFVLPPLLRALHHVVLVDNGSTDGTPDLAQEIAEREGFSDRLRVTSYPFDVARCGPDHLETPASSVHSLTYFYNWSFSQVRTTYALKWDGDMVLTESGVAALQDLDWQLEASQRVVTMPRYPLYVADERTAFLDVGLANNEPWGWPNRPGYVHVKAMEWELPLWPSDARQTSLPDWSCLELKWLDADEFAHWSTTDFTVSSRTQRKEREFRVHEALNNGTEPPIGVVAVHAPEGIHVVDFVRRQWLIDERAMLAELMTNLREERRAARRAKRKNRQKELRAFDRAQQMQRRQLNRVAAGLASVDDGSGSDDENLTSFDEGVAEASQT